MSLLMDGVFDHEHFPHFHRPTLIFYREMPGACYDVFSVLPQSFPKLAQKSQKGHGARDVQMLRG